MKTLYIVRHAKSSWDHPGLSDDQRPLLQKGKKRTKLVTDYLQKNNNQPALILSSHATRAYETAKLFANALGFPENKIIVTESIYHGNADTMINTLFGIADDIDSLMMFGHNPTFTYFANMFLDNSIENLPTSGVVCIEFKTDKWEEIMTAEKRTKFVISPKILKISSEK
jgi:phosphohistidine phosphatase